MLTFRAATCFLLGAYILVYGYSHAYAAQSRTKLFVAYGSVSSNAAPLWIAQEQGFFNKYGMDAEPVFIIGGRAIQAMVAGQSRLASSGPYT